MLPLWLLEVRNTWVKYNPDATKLSSKCIYLLLSWLLQFFAKQEEKPIMKAMIAQKRFPGWTKRVYVIDIIRNYMGGVYEKICHNRTLINITRACKECHIIILQGSHVPIRNATIIVFSLFSKDQVYLHHSMLVNTESIYIMGKWQ